MASYRLVQVLIARPSREALVEVEALLVGMIKKAQQVFGPQHPWTMTFVGLLEETRQVLVRSQP